MAETEAAGSMDKPKDTVEKITRTPRVRIFTIGEDNKENTEYEAVLDKINKGECELIHSSGHWHEGVYKVQIHFHDVKKEEVKRTDTDTIDSLKEPASKKKKTEKKKSDEDEHEDRSDAVPFDSKMDTKKIKSKKSQASIKKD